MKINQNIFIMGNCEFKAGIHKLWTKIIFLSDTFFSQLMFSFSHRLFQTLGSRWWCPHQPVKEAKKNGRNVIAEFESHMLSLKFPMIA